MVPQLCFHNCVPCNNTTGNEIQISDHMGGKRQGLSKNALRALKNERKKNLTQSTEMNVRGERWRVVASLGYSSLSFYFIFSFQFIHHFGVNGGTLSLVSLTLLFSSTRAMSSDIGQSTWPIHSLRLLGDDKSD